MLPRQFTRTQRRSWLLRRGTLLFFLMFVISCVWTGYLLWGEGRALLGDGQVAEAYSGGGSRGLAWVGEELIWAGEPKGSSLDIKTILLNAVLPGGMATGDEPTGTAVLNYTGIGSPNADGAGISPTGFGTGEAMGVLPADLEEDYTLWADPYANNWPTYPMDNVLLIPQGEPRVLIYHTHNSEVYTGDDKIDGVGGVVGAGRLLTQTLESVYGIKTAHSEAVNDRPDFTRAYINSQNLLTQYVTKYPAMDIVIDLHRDAGMDKRQDTLVTIEGKGCARLLLVMGDAHTGYKTNVAFANLIQAKAEELYPGLMKPLRIANDRRYNQQLHSHGILLEVGSDLNTSEDAANAMVLFARVLAEVLEEMA